MLLSEFVRDATRALTSVYPPEEARAVISALCRERLGTESYTHIVNPSLEIDTGNGLDTDMRRLLDGEPLQYVLGYACFYGRRFKVGPAVLIPRPETELLINHALGYARRVNSPRILDLCTGSGCIAWTIREECPSSDVTAVDISREALDLARSQFPEPGPEFICADILENDFKAPGAPFDLICANPPYIAESEKTAMHVNVLAHEPHLALFVKDSDPLMFYRAIAGIAADSLRPGGYGIVEINSRFGRETADIFRGKGFENVRIIRDLHGDDRFISFEKRV